MTREPAFGNGSAAFVTNLNDDAHLERDRERKRERDRNRQNVCVRVLRQRACEPAINYSAGFITTMGAMMMLLAWRECASVCERERKRVHILSDSARICVHERQRQFGDQCGNCCHTAHLERKREGKSKRDRWRERVRVRVGLYVCMYRNI